MPWQNQGGGGWPGGGGKGPWGQGPNGSGGRGPRTPPDLEDLIQRVQDQFKSALPGGSGGRMSWLLPVLFIAAIWLYNSVYVVRPRSEEHTSELQSRLHLVCRLLLEKKKK